MNQDENSIIKNDGTLDFTRFVKLRKTCTHKQGIDLEKDVRETWKKELALKSVAIERKFNILLENINLPQNQKTELIMLLFEYFENAFDIGFTADIDFQGMDWGAWHDKYVVGGEV